MKFVKIVLENMVGIGNLVGSFLVDLKEVIGMIEDKLRIGVCIDICYIFVVGYDISIIETFNNFWKEFNDVIGFKYLSVVYLNDFKVFLGVNRDLYECLG